MCCLNNAVDETDDDKLWNGSEDEGNVRSEYEEDEGTVCEDGESDTDWQSYIESDMLCILSVWD